MASDNRTLDHASPRSPNSRSEPSDTPSREVPVAALAAALLRRAGRASGTAPLFVVLADQDRAERLGRLLAAAAPRLRVAPLPAWDVPPYDAVPPSVAVMGVRAGTLRWLANRDDPPDLVLTTPAAMLQRVPPPGVWEPAHVAFRLGDALDPEAAAGRLEAAGYFLDERVDEPGEYAVRGRVLDVFPAAAPRPCRVEIEDGRIAAIRSYDPATQRSVAETELLVVDPATEAVGAPGAGATTLEELPACHGTLATVLDYAPRATVHVEAEAAPLADSFLEQVEEGFRLRLDIARGPRPLPPDAIYLDREEWRAALQDRVESLDVAAEPLPEGLARADALARFVAEQRRAGRTVVLAAESSGALRRLAAAAGAEAAAVPDLHAVAALPAGSLATLRAPVDEGFVAPRLGLAVVPAATLPGGAEGGRRRPTLPLLLPAGEELRVGGPAIHLEHGMGIVDGLRPAGAEAGGELVAMRYAGDATLAVPTRDAALLWAYDAEPRLDRIGGDGWKRRRETLEAEIARAAAGLRDAVAGRERRSAPRIRPAPDTLRRFADRFPYRLTADQAAAIGDILRDMASGRPMDRLVCGDVGLGKTEVALRAAAAAVLAGRQVAVVAPTTVLARQHLRTFRRRFAPFGVRVEELSRHVPAAARRVRRELADGTLRLVVGTHAVAGKGVAFADLALLVIDEEHRFGAQQKARLRDLGGRAHTLALSATPIPRTLQAGLVGLQQVSVIATPPPGRMPVRTTLAAFEPELLRQALLRERRLRGQSFVVCPRIADIAPMQSRLEALVPELELRVAHGRMPAAALDDVMLGFAEGEGDVLLATGIIESGLDLPRANTMIVCGAERFGLAQLHQLRGRVGRGSRRGSVYLMTAEGQERSAGAARRLRALSGADGFEVSGRDLQARGAGDLLGPEQSGRIRLLGAALYRHLLGCAAAGKPLDDPVPAVETGVAGCVPADYVPEEEVRLNLYRRIHRAGSAAELDDLEDEIADRFGPPPAEVTDLLALARLGLRGRAMGVARIDAGPRGIAVTLRDGRRPPPARRLRGAGLSVRDGRIVRPADLRGDDPRRRLDAADRLLRKLEAVLEDAPGEK